ncbi:MAG: ATP-grasp domain-containing protein, partial [Actinobacteria bacterium]|nr:ATP-grasp domain-containing protein [Actinomycetota bacterium]NIS34894.1 ATP-grasp domain-containing protein [Actinomycetota bacterium]NIT97811.1 ATP-grasp domain-containing protein [Actinomycetota bacterium]NIU21459.1 ATP-grasp domain-containing protein [Actinomycetota bacterium]NIU69641.1 ATP-grasp domain-containing protein [Actinomycetota bacterium]
RSVDGVVEDHGVMENVHVDQILDTTVVPAAVGPDVAERARAIAVRIAEAWDLVGVLCVELFLADGELIANEVAPRPHNSGHCTIEAAASSQFEQQLRTVCGMAPGDGRCRPAAMVQLLGDLWVDGEPDWNAAFSEPGVHLHLYGKTEARPGRKMGHMTCVADDPAAALRRVKAVRDALTP